MKKHVVIYITTPNKRLALKIGKACIQDKLVACINVIDKISSVYEWQGKLCEEKECILIMKTVQKKSFEIKKKVEQLHSYSCPCILILPILDGNENFLNWVSQSCK
jgi:periplasmic divalent cation tolerance protein